MAVTNRLPSLFRRHAFQNYEDFLCQNVAHKILLKVYLTLCISIYYILENIRGDVYSLHHDAGKQRTRLRR